MPSHALALVRSAENLLDIDTGIGVLCARQLSRSKYPIAKVQIHGHVLLHLEQEAKPFGQGQGSKKVEAAAGCLSGQPQSRCSTASTCPLAPAQLHHNTVDHCGSSRNVGSFEKLSRNIRVEFVGVPS